MRKTQTGMRRRTKVLLAVSLGLNMLVIGMAGGAFFHSGGPSHVQGAAFGPYTRALSPQDRKVVGQALRADIGSYRQNLPKIRAAYAALKTRADGRGL